MRMALSLEPGSERAKKYGCTCRAIDEWDQDCPVHFILYITKQAHFIEKHIYRADKNLKQCQIFIMILLILDLLSRFL
jgi:hypothetical protein